jgi:hypothetical protein
MNQCYLCLERAECTEDYHGHYFMVTCKRQIEAKHRSLRQVSPSAVKQNVRLMHEDAERWRQGFVAFKPGQDRRAAAEAARNEAKAFEKAESYNDSARVRDDLVMDKETYRVFKAPYGWSGEKADNDFDKKHDEQGSDEDTDGGTQRIKIKDPVERCRDMKGKRTSDGAVTNNPIPYEQAVARTKRTKRQINFEPAVVSSDGGDDDAGNVSIGRSDASGLPMSAPGTEKISASLTTCDYGEESLSHGRGSPKDRHDPEPASARALQRSRADTVDAVLTSRFEKKDPKSMDTVEFLDAKELLVERFLYYIQEINAPNCGMVAQLTSQQKSLDDRGGDANDLTHKTADLVAELQTLGTELCNLLLVTFTFLSFPNFICFTH